MKKKYERLKIDINFYTDVILTSVPDNILTDDWEDWNT